MQSSSLYVTQMALLSDLSLLIVNKDSADGRQSDNPNI